MSFADQVHAITGASSCIGWALAKALAAQKCRVGLVARRADKLEALAAEIRAAGGTVVLAGADVAQREQTLQAVAQLRQQLGPIDLLVANAGVGAPTHLHPFNL